MEHLEKPENCTEISRIREGIDYLDQKIIELLALRFSYTCAAHKFKFDEKSVRAPERKAKVLASIRKHAIEKNLNPDIYGEAFEIIIDHSIEEQLKIFESQLETLAQ